jgi:hydrogenase maturation protein HypF
LLDGATAGSVGLAFHEALAAAMLDAARRVRHSQGVDVVGLTGGVFQNALLSDIARASLERAGFTVLMHETVPANDGGLALGQAAVAALGGAKESG